MWQMALQATPKHYPSDQFEDFVTDWQAVLRRSELLSPFWFSDLSFIMSSPHSHWSRDLNGRGTGKVTPTALCTKPPKLNIHWRSRFQELKPHWDLGWNNLTTNCAKLGSFRNHQYDKWLKINRLVTWVFSTLWCPYSWSKLNHEKNTGLWSLV